jgi:hypothetical protein
MDKVVFKTLHELVFLHGNHCSQQNATIGMNKVKTWHLE